MLGRPAPHYETGTAHPQRSVEVGETLEQELCARPGRMATVQKTVVEAEHRHDSVVMVERSTQRRMVVQPQVAAKPEQGGQREIRPGSRRSAAVERGPRWLPSPWVPLPADALMLADANWAGWKAANHVGPRSSLGLSEWGRRGGTLAWPDGGERDGGMPHGRGQGSRR